MRIGIVIGLHGTVEAAPTWTQVRNQVVAAERIGFDLAVIEDALLYRDDDGAVGYWESVSMAGALCAATSRIEIGHSVINAPYRSAALMAKITESLDEISGGRFFLGIGLGNTMDYDQFGILADRRYSRFAEAIQIIHRLLRTGRAAKGRNVTCDVGVLLSNGVFSAEIVIGTKGGSSLTAEASVAAVEADADQSNNTAAVTVGICRRDCP